MTGKNDTTPSILAFLEAKYSFGKKVNKVPNRTKGNLEKTNKSTKL